MSVQAKLDEWKRQLLDLSKRNRLLCFRETKRQTLRIEEPGLDELFARLVTQEKSLTVVGADDQIELGFDEEAAEDRVASPRPRVLGPDEVVFAGSADRAASALYTLRTRSRTEWEERGVGVLYLAFGLLRWFEADQSDQEILSPLLLVPVELQRNAVSQPYRLVPRDDDIVVNPTLAKVMQDQFGIDLPGIPSEETWSLAAYLSSVAAAVSAQRRWAVERTAYLSAFSFLKLSMYRDLELGLGLAASSSIIQALAGDASQLAQEQRGIEEIPADQLDDRVPPDRCLQVLDADSSQQQAIELAKAGGSFVLQGPPGTGKSQTIANVIAEVVGQGRTVLFVSEKAAALDVVHRRLTQVGLADGCLALHSHKANKRDVVAELARVYQLGAGGHSEDPFDYERLAQRRETLNTYAKELHAKREPFHRSVFEVEGLLAQRDGAPDVAFAVHDVAGLTVARLEAMRDAVAGLSGSTAAIAALDGNPWRGSVLEGQSIEVQRVTEERLGAALGVCADSLQAGRALAAALRLSDEALTPASMERMARIADALADGPPFMGSWLAPGRLPELTESARVAAERQATLVEQGAVMAEVFEEGVLEYDLDALSARLRDQYRSGFARLGGAFRRECRMLSAFTATGKKPSYAALLGVVPAAIAVRECRRWFEAEDVRLRDEFGDWYASSSTDWTSLRAALGWAGEVADLFADGVTEPFQLAVADILADRDALRSAAAKTRESLKPVRVIAREILRWFDENAPAAAVFSASEITLFDRLTGELDRLRVAIDQLAPWTRLSRAVRTCIDAGVGDPVPLLQATPISGVEYVVALERRVYSLWLDHWISRTPALRDFEAASHTHAIHEFRRLDRELRDAARRQVKAKLAMRRPAASAAAVTLASSQPALLMKEAKKKKRHKPLRRLFAEIPDLVTALKPCLMMSPLSVGQFLSLEAPPFDVVVFDEASQVKPEDAVGAIMRGRQAIVVGDSKQLPPTTFFDVSNDDRDEDEYYEDETGVFESILDLCGTVGLPERMLEWHYRSRHEGLIAFSNHFLYDNRLVTFPAPEFDGAGTAVEFRYLADGVYDRSRSRTNAREVQEVVEIVREHAAMRPDQSLGVVAFSQAQMTAIDRALWRARAEEPALEEFFTSARDEPVFVKNLENVQGDERDVIVFSIGYGKDAAGKLAMNFGPLNNRGGERRLNVAVTRAREGVILVSSIRGAEVDITRSQAEGVRLLKNYLDYAERGVGVLDGISVADADAEYGSVFEEEVGRVLESMGYAVMRQVGCSGYRIDLAVVHPALPGLYAIGIECDGASYHSAATARERDRLREEVLRARGWRLHRIWSTDWFRARSVEVGRLRRAIDEAIDEVTRTQGVRREQRDTVVEVARSLPDSDPDPEPGDADDSAILLASMLDDSEASVGGDPLSSIAEPYVEYQPVARPLDFYDSPGQVRSVLQAVVNAEGPIHIDVAARRVAGAWGIARVGHKVKGVIVEAAQAAAGRNELTLRGDFLYASDSRAVRVRRGAVDGRTRKAAHIAPEEIAEAARRVLQDHLRLTLQDLIVAAARVLGFERVGSEVREAMLRGIGELVDSGAAEEVSGDVVLR